ncbi:DUF4907 domain-containing protein [Dyadobacter sp. CY343]|uniref:DUF4907 domain-containing protein n=1 Tax=Dyadobacter sp. CY343 TaxID=2907299 RepID=UPI001F3B56F6|nr:DUF4907 domain-containing protein [Dyadobacter sp. CY343]MCE7059685.1 DUF4907 domain-containing protein [Dyadobacter sp. CY343]
MIRKNKSIIIILSTLALAIAAYLLIFPKKTEESSNGQGRSLFKVETFQGQAGWAYRIYQDSVPVIEQLTPPGIVGNRGFQSEQMAKSTGLLVKKKLDQGIFPPTISSGELDSLGVKY